MINEVAVYKDAENDRERRRNNSPTNLVKKAAFSVCKHYGSIDTITRRHRQCNCLQRLKHAVQTAINTWSLLDGTDVYQQSILRSREIGHGTSQ